MTLKQKLLKQNSFADAIPNSLFSAQCVQIKLFTRINTFSNCFIAENSGNLRLMIHVNSIKTNDLYFWFIEDMKNFRNTNHTTLINADSGRKLGTTKMSLKWCLNPSPTQIILTYSESFYLNNRS